MIFAGAYASRSCSQCGLEFARTSSASLLFFLALIGLGTGTLTPAMGARVGEGALAWVFSGGACLALVVVLGTVTDVLVRSQTPLPNECPECGTEMVQAGGRYDGMIPTVQDVLILIGFVACVWGLLGLLTR